jgi:hypothetical protein
MSYGESADGTCRTLIPALDELDAGWRAPRPRDFAAELD